MAKGRGSSLGRWVAMLIGVAALVLVAWALVRNLDERRLEWTIAELDAAGYVTRWSDLEPDVADEDNAAELYQEVIRRGRQLPGWEPWNIQTEAWYLALTDPSERLIADYLSGATREDLAALDDVLNLAREAASRPSAVFPGDYAVSTRIVGGRLRRLVQFLCARALVVGDPDPSGQSAADLRAAFAIARHAGAPPGVVALLNRLTYGWSALGATRQLLLLAPRPRELISAIDVDRGSDILEPNLTGRLAYVSTLMREVGPDGFIVQRRGLWGKVVGGLTHGRDVSRLRRHLLRLRDAIEASRQPDEEALVALAEIDLNVNPWLRRPNPGDQLSDYRLAVELTEVGVELLEIRNATGRFPDDLSFLIEAPKPHPISGETIQWLREGDKRVLRGMEIYRGEYDEWGPLRRAVTPTAGPR